MSYVISFVGTKDGQGATSTALAVAFNIAGQGHTVLFVDADMSGTSTAVDHVLIDPAHLGMNNLVGEGAINSEMLLAQAVVSREARLQIVPGLHQIYGSNISHLLRRLLSGQALRALPHDFVIFDLGCAWSHVLLQNPRLEAQAVSALSARVFVVIQDAPVRLARSLDVLRAADPPKAEIIVLDTRSGVMSRKVKEAITNQLPGLSITATIPWDQKGAIKAEDDGRPISGLGEAVVRQAEILQRARVVLETASPAVALPAG